MPRLSLRVVNSIVTLPLLSVAMSLSLALDVTALPAGKAWSPNERLAVPGFAFLGGPRLEVDPSGSPVLFSLAAFGPSGDDAFGFRWASLWVRQWDLGADALWLWPVETSTGTQYLVWNGGSPSNNEWLFLTSLNGKKVSLPDTVAHDVGYITEYSAAVSPARKWVALSDAPANRIRLRLLYSDTTHVWREVPLPSTDQGDNGISVATLDDTTALVAWTGIDEFGIHWGTLRGKTWTEGLPVQESGYSNRPRFRRRPSGGQWLAWGASQPYILISTFSEGAWAYRQGLYCAYRDGLPQHYSSSPDLSRDEAEYPAVAWAAQDVTATYTVCVCMSDESGFQMGEELAGSATDISPTIARDVDGDVCVAWWRYFDTTTWTHTFTTATCTSPSVTTQGSQHTVSWTLSQAAPRTWWAILRSTDGNAFYVAARIQAGGNPEMTWMDPIQSPDLPHYRIRRECLDTRYQWLSPEATVGVDGSSSRGGHLILARLSSNPSGRPIRYELRNATSGALEVRVFDLRGRQLFRQRQYASGSGFDTIELDLASVSPAIASGLYFVRVVDASGRESPTGKLVWLR